MRGLRPSRRRRAYAGNERGSVLILVTLSLVAVLSMFALVVDLGMGYSARSEAQRAADAAALAGASAFLDYPVEPLHAVEPAKNLARQYARLNEILHRPIRDDEVDVLVHPDADPPTVEVVIRRTGLPTMFARIFGVDSLAVTARAVAQVANSTTANCMAPWAIVDWWDEATDDGNNIPDDDEEWTFGPGDRYVPFGAGQGPEETGLGSRFRGPTADFGRQMTIKPAPASGGNVTAGQYYVWSHGRGELGPEAYKARLLDCDPTPIRIGETYRRSRVSVDLANATEAAVDSLYRLDPDAVWRDDGVSPHLESEFGMRSPRVVRVPLVDPSKVTNNTVTFSNIGLFFIESATPGPNGEITGRFLYYVPGTPDGGGGPSRLIRYVRLTG